MGEVSNHLASAVGKMPGAHVGSSSDPPTEGQNKRKRDVDDNAGPASQAANLQPPPTLQPGMLSH